MLLTYVLLFAGFACLVKGADWFVEGSSSVAKLLRVPSIIIGLTIVAFGTSAPEAAVSITAAIKGQNDIAIGNVIGSNFFNLLIVIGVCSFISPVKITKNMLKKEFPFSIIVTVILLIMCLDAFIFGSENITISRIDGGILLAIFVWFLGNQIYYALQSMKGKVPRTDEEKGQLRSPLQSALLIIIGLVLVVLGGDLVVDNASKIAESFGLSQAFIGLTIVAIGTSLPELVTSIVAARKGENDLALGNIIGSNIFNVIFILGTSASIHPINVGINTIYDTLILIAVSISTFIFANTRKKISSREGIIMILMYFIYMTYIIIR